MSPYFDNKFGLKEEWFKKIEEIIIVSIDFSEKKRSKNIYLVDEKDITTKVEPKLLPAVIIK